MTYCLIWNKEIIEEEIETREEAEYLQREYAMAYKGIVNIVRERT